MITRKHFWVVLISLVYIANQTYSQPFYFYHGSDIKKFFRYNLQSGVTDVFHSDTVNPYGIVSWDPTQQWVLIKSDNSYKGRSLFDGGKDEYYISIKAININNLSSIHLFPDQYSHAIGTSPNSFYYGNDLRGQVVDGIVYNPKRNVLYVTCCLPHPDSLRSWTHLSPYQRTAIYDASTFAVLDTLPVPPGWINSISSISDDGNYLYVENCEYYKNKTSAIGKYSLLTKQLISNRDLSDIVVNGGYKDVDDSKKGRYLIQYLYPSLNLADKKFAIYDIDRDSTYTIIPFPAVANGSISSDGKYVIIEETPVRPDYATSTSGDDFLHPGRISIFNGVTGQLIQKLNLLPDGKVLIFDNYPNMLYYYLPNEQRSINIDLSKLAPVSGCNVKLVSSDGIKLTGGTLQYYEGSWKDATNNNDGTFFVNTTKTSLSLRMTYEYGTQTKSNVPIGSDTITFQTVNAQIQLQNSNGVLILAPLRDTGTVKYYAGAWREFGTTTNGVANKELLPNNYSFRMTYEYASKDKKQDLNENPTVVFQTVNAAVQLQNSQGSLMPAPSGDEGTVQYYSGAWREFGTTTNGVANKELLPNKYSFRMTYAYASKDKKQDLSENPTVVFQTVNAAVQLQNSQGSLMPAPSGDEGVVKYYSGAWKEFGTTTNGVANKELLPNNYSFRMTYEYASKDKKQDLNENPTVVFQTVNAQVQLKNSQGNLMPASSGDEGAVKYYSGAWREFGTTTNRVANKELLPNNYSFRMTYEYATIDKKQDISSNNILDFSTVLCTIQVKNTQNQPIEGATASYYSGAWRQIGTTANGEITKELLPLNLSFRVKYGTQQQDKKQDLSNNNIVEFTLQ